MKSDAEIGYVAGLVDGVAGAVAEDVCETCGTVGCTIEGEHG